MTYTYDDTDLSTDLAKVRKTIGDVEEHEDYSLTDEEITSNIDNASNLQIASYLSARDRYSKSLLWASRNVATVNADRNSVVAAMERLCEKLLKDAGGEAVIKANSLGNIQVAAGMLSQDELDNARDDTDYPDPPFRVGMDSNPGAAAPEDERREW